MAKICVVYLDINTGFIPDLHHGLASLAASVNSSGHVFNLYHLTQNEEPDKVADKILEQRPDVIGFSLTTNQRRYLEPYSQAIAAKCGILQIAGGVHPTIDPHDVLRLKSIQGVCVGEAEYVLPMLLEKVDNKKSFFNTPSFLFRGLNSDFVDNSVLPLEHDLSKLPLPDYSVFNTDKVNDLNSGWMNMMITRGCPYNCSYCCNHVFRSIYPNKQNYVRIPPVDYAISVIKNNLEKYPRVKGVLFVDDLLFFKIDWFREFIESYRTRIGVPFMCNARIEQLSQEVCSLLKKGGCQLVRVGIESGNEWVRKSLLNRKMTNNQIIEACRRVKEAGMSLFSYNILGLPFETKEQMMDTFYLNKRVGPDQGAVYYFFPYPATRLYSICEEYGLFQGSNKDKSSYLEGPSIRLTHCKEKMCRRVYNRLKVYLLIASARKGLGVFAAVLNICYCFPSFFVRIFTKRSGIKNFLRKIYYRRFHLGSN